MPPQVAAVVTVSVVLYLLVSDLKQRPTSRALWIPLTWMFIAGTRSLAEWFSLSAPDQALTSVDGSWIDSLAFQLLMVGGIVVLMRRKLDWGSVVLRNKWVWLFFLVGAASVIWSVEPWLSWRRLVKASGNAVMALVLLTDKEPYAAVRAVLTRLSLIALPLSILFIRYYPELGREYHMGLPMFTGVATQKNGLGQLCLIGGIVVCWSLLYQPKERVTVGGSLGVRVEFLILVMVCWLTVMADSATALSCLAASVVVLAFSRLPFIARAPRRILSTGLLALIVIGTLEWTFGLKDSALSMLDRDPTLTTRVPMWDQLLGAADKPMLGPGFEAFWSSDIGRDATARWGVHQAHNGYIDMYLNLGLIGLAVLLGGILTGLPKIARQLPDDRAAAMLRLTLIVVVVLYNWTEAGFRGASNIWVLFLVSLIDPPGSRPPNTRVQPVFRMPAPGNLAPAPAGPWQANRPVRRARFNPKTATEKRK